MSCDDQVNDPQVLVEGLQAEWRDHEIEVALADFTCAEKVDYQKAYMTAQYRLENQFIEDHKSELDAMVAEIAQAKGK